MKLVSILCQPFDYMLTIIPQSTSSPIAVALVSTKDKLLDPTNPMLVAPFAHWALRTHFVSQPSLGTIRSLRLFRQDKTLLRHEYAIVGIGDGDTPTSWLRLERATVNGARIGASSLGPVFAGTASRDEVTISADGNDLILPGAVEVAGILIPSNGFPSTGLGIHDVGLCVHHLVKSHRQYVLFGANCRWFARQIILRLTRRAAELGLGPVIAMDGKDVDISRLEKGLGDDLSFGANTIQSDERNPEVQFEVLFDLARAAWQVSRFEDAYRLLKASLVKLDSVPGDKPVRSDARAECLGTLSLILNSLGRTDEALTETVRACKIIDALPDVYRRRPYYIEILRCRFSCLRKLDRTDEAIRVGRDALTQCRASSLDLKGHLLIIVIREVGGYMYDIKHNAEALELAIEGIKLARELSKDAPDHHIESLAAVLGLYARAMDRAQPTHVRAILSAVREACTLYQRTITLFPQGDMLRQGRLATLATLYAQYASRASLWDEACEASSLAAKTERALAETQDPQCSPSGQWRDVGVAYIRYSLCLRRLDRIEECCDANEQACMAFRKLVEAGDRDARDALIGSLGLAVDDLYGAGRALAAENYKAEAASLRGMFCSIATRLICSSKVSAELPNPLNIDGLPQLSSLSISDSASSTPAPTSLARSSILYREITAEREAIDRDRIASLMQKSSAFAQASRWPEAISINAEAVRINRNIAASDFSFKPGGPWSAYGMSCMLHAIYLRKGGSTRAQEACEAWHEASAAFRKVSSAHREDSEARDLLARCLGQEEIDLRALGRIREANACRVEIGRARSQGV